MDPGILVPFIIAGAILFFATIWSLIILLIAKLGGWRKVAAAKPFNEMNAGALVESARRNSVTFGFTTSYSGVITVSVFENGVRLRPALLFRPFHPPIFLERDDLKKGKFGGNESMGFYSFNNLEGKMVTIAGKGAALMHRFAESRNAYF
ncbi:MAG TPA: hypothetical protein VI112_08970 [Bacteroidia bacterium]|jgi:hypothetical protein